MMYQQWRMEQQEMTIITQSLLLLAYSTKTKTMMEWEDQKSFMEGTQVPLVWEKRLQSVAWPQRCLQRMSICSSKCLSGFKTNCANLSIHSQLVAGVDLVQQQSAKMICYFPRVKTHSRQMWRGLIISMYLIWQMISRRMGDLTSHLTSMRKQWRKRIIKKGKMTQKTITPIVHNPIKLQSVKNRISIHHLR
ncbi:hypothetical protein FGO68_gene8217 [Halteria grandinella]|uniref:Uncharacterized protein n=1 Tax=Halteria grandinella TaxID=5974 RepID=A0A8J8P4S0_HALGN|nr:hypothetical protein FGO68_gene8217 [Halteria grandinella]